MTARAKPGWRSCRATHHFSRNPAIPPALKKHATAGIRAGRATLPIFRGVSVARLPRHPPAGGLHVLQTCELAPSVPPFLAMTRLLRPGHHVEPARPHYRLTHRSFTTFRMTARAKPDPRPQRLGRKLACTKCMQRSGHRWPEGTRNTKMPACECGHFVPGLTDYFNTPSFFPTRVNAAMAVSIWAAVCAALIWTRMRAWPSGTTG